MVSEPLDAATTDILDEVKRVHKSREVVSVEEEKIKVVIFRLGDAAYAFHGGDIKEILSGCEIYPVPSLPDYLPGLVNVRGDIESVVDIAYFLGGRGASGAALGGPALVAMAEKGSFRSGLIIDAVEDVTDIPVSHVKPPLATLAGAARELAAGEIDLGGRTATLIDIEKLAAKVTL